MSKYSGKEKGLELANIPQLLSLLEQQEIINTTQKGEILSILDAAKKSGKKAFAGEIGAELGLYDKKTLDNTLVEQTTRKAEAAARDIQTIAKHGIQEAPVWLKANWGNNGVNPASDSPTLADGVSAAASMAQNIVMLANTNPEMISDRLIAAVSAAANLARGIHSGSSARAPLSDKAAEWMETTQKGLREAVDASGQAPKDRNGDRIDLEEFIMARLTELKASITLSLEKSEAHRKEAVLEH